MKSISPELLHPSLPPPFCHPTAFVLEYSVLPTKDGVSVHAPMWDLPIHPCMEYQLLSSTQSLLQSSPISFSIITFSLSTDSFQSTYQHSRISLIWKTKTQPPLIPYHSPPSVHFSVCLYSNSESHCSTAFSTVACCFCDTLSSYGFMIWLVLSALSHPPLSDPLPLSHFWILMCFRDQPQGHFISYIHSWSDRISFFPLGLNT